MVVRYLIGYPLDMAEQAARVIDGEADLQVTDGVIMETAYVLRSVYGVARETVEDYLIDFLQKENIGAFGLDKGQVIQALLICRPSGRVSFADALLWAAAQSTREKIVYSLDERFPTDGIEVRKGR